MADEEGTQGSDNDANEDEEGTQGSEETPDYDTWFESQDEQVQKIVSGRLANLESAHGRVKEERNALKASLAAIRKDKSLDADAKLDALSEKLEEANRKSSFYETVPKEIANPKNAFILARGNGCLKKDGSLDVVKFKEACPELFTKQRPPTNPGNGNDAPSVGDMNAKLRAMAG